jgi:hypothetical protein
VSVVREYKPTVPEALPFVRAVYSQTNGGAGCCLHIVLDDNNVDDHFVESCIKWADERGHELCAKTARMLRSMSKTQRWKLSKWRHL